MGGFFKTAYKFGGPFVAYIIASFLTIGAAETLRHFPGLKALNAFGTDHLGLQLMLLTAGILVWLALTLISCRLSCRRFEKIDL